MMTGVESLPTRELARQGEMHRHPAKTPGALERLLFSEDSWGFGASMFPVTNHLDLFSPSERHVQRVTMIDIVYFDACPL
jgi:hypothetical protein